MLLYGSNQHQQQCLLHPLSARCVWCRWRRVVRCRSFQDRRFCAKPATAQADRGAPHPDGVHHGERGTRQTVGDHTQPRAENRYQEDQQRGYRACADREARHQSGRCSPHSPTCQWQLDEGARRAAGGIGKRTVSRHVYHADATGLPAQDQGPAQVERTDGRHGTRKTEEMADILSAHDARELYV